MRKRLVATLVFAASLAALVSAAASPPEGFAVPAGVAVREKETGPLLGTTWNEAERRNELVHVDPGRLDPRERPGDTRLEGERWTRRDRGKIGGHGGRV